MELKEIIGKRLKDLRENQLISQGQLAKELNVSQAAVAQYESGRNYPSNEVLVWYADRFGVSMDFIYGRTEDPYSHEIDITKDKDYDKMYEVAKRVILDLRKEEKK